jgi:hypothetical protein
MSAKFAEQTPFTAFGPKVESIVLHQFSSDLHIFLLLLCTNIRSIQSLRSQWYQCRSSDEKCQKHSFLHKNWLCRCRAATISKWLIYFWHILVDTYWELSTWSYELVWVSFACARNSWFWEVPRISTHSYDCNFDSNDLVQQNHIVPNKSYNNH